MIPRKTILVAEDDARNRRLFRAILSAKGYELIEAVNGREAVDLARECTPDLILLDIQMPVMDGFEALKTLKDDADTADIATWALTSYAMPGDKERILQAGCDGYIMKPIDVPSFVQRIERHFANKGEPDIGDITAADPDCG